MLQLPYRTLPSRLHLVRPNALRGRGCGELRGALRGLGEHLRYVPDLGQRRFCLLHAEAVVIGINDGNRLSPRDDAAEVYGDRADTSRNFHTDCRLVVSGECAVDGYSFTERRFGDSRGFNLPSRSALSWSSLPLSLRSLVITLA